MAYERTNWVAEETPLSADNMNNIEDGIEELQAEKVDKETGKGLYPDADKTKLAGIAAGAEVNVQSDWNQSSTSADDFIKNKPGNATTSAAGLMSAADKTKLDGIQAGAQANPGAATTSAAGLMSAADKSKLNGIAAGAEKNPTTVTATKRLSGNVTVAGHAAATLEFANASSDHVLQGVQLAASAVGICVAGWRYSNGSILVDVFNTVTSSITLSTSTSITLVRYSGMN